MPNLQRFGTGESPVASAKLNLIVDALTGAGNTPINHGGINDSINYALTVRNQDIAGKAVIVYAPDGVTVLLQVTATGVLASPAGGAASAIATVSGTQTLTNKTISEIAGQGNVITLPSARVFNSAAETTTSGAALALTFDSERYKTDAAMHSTVTNASRLVATVAGKYRATGCASFGASAAGTFRSLSIRLNGATLIGLVQVAPAGAGPVTVLNVTCEYQMAVNDYVELLATQDTGAGLNVVVGANYSPEFSLSYVSA